MNLQKETTSDHFNKVINEIYKFGESNRFVLRQVFISIWHNVLCEDLQMFYTYFMKKFIQMQDDRVPNVRIILAKCWGLFLSNFLESECPEDSDKSEQVEEEKETPVDNNVQKNRIYYGRILIDEVFMSMVNQIRNDSKEDVRNQISDQVNFDKLLAFINDNRKQIEEVKVIDHDDKLDDVPTARETELTGNEETIDKSEDEFSQLNPDSSVGIWSLISAREIIEDVINSSEDEVDEDKSLE